jgi:selT/selW/selH-like putative selenoprotein
LEDELKKEFGSELNVELIPGSGGVYLVCLDGQQVFSKKELNRFPKEGEIVALLTKDFA